MKSRAISIDLSSYRALLLILLIVIIATFALAPKISRGADQALDNNWVSTAAGKSHSLGIQSDGTLWAWGGNGVGQLGDGTTVEKHSPFQISRDKWISALARFVHVAAGLQSGYCDGPDRPEDLVGGRRLAAALGP